MTISEAYAVYELNVVHNAALKPKTRKNYLWAINSLIEVTGDIDITFVGIDHIIRWKMQMRENGLKSTSINTNLGKIRSLLKFLLNNEVHVLDYTKITREKEIYVPKTFLTPDEVGELIAAAKTIRNKALIAAYFGTGCRLSELLNLEREEFEQAPLVDKEHGIYEVWVLGKGDKYRKVYFDQQVHNLISEYLETRRDRFKPLFMSNQNRRLGPSRVEKMVHEVTRRAGLEKVVTPHILRHSFTSDLVTKGAPISATSALLGHANITTTLGIYTHINDLQTQQAYTKHHSDVIVDKV